MVEEKKHCKGCNTTRNIDEFYPDKWSSTGRASKCKYCHREYHKQFSLEYKNKKWTKNPKNTFPDSDWVWEQIEQNLGHQEFNRRLEQKYGFKEHGNKGKKHKSHKNPWLERKENGRD